MSARSSPGPRTSTTPILEERTSLDTLADRLGLLEMSQTQSEKPPRQSNRPSIGQGYVSAGSGQPLKMTRPKPKAEVSFCCFRIPLEEESPPARPRPRPVQAPVSAPAKPGKKPSSQHLAPVASRPRPSISAQSGGRSSHHSSAHSTSSQTSQYLSLIPPHASPQTASLLMTELAKPISKLDEPGYIYMFWLTPESQTASPPTDAARSLLAPPTLNRPAGQRRPSDVLASFAAATNNATNARGLRSGSKKNTILLKIGRATNVQRRLNEWTRQCGYDVSLIRYYPYISSSNPGPVSVPRKMPHSHKVERLIHIELAGLGLRVADRERCDACGREHREWFEVDASRSGVMRVDEAVRRWVDWDEGRLP